MTEWHWITIFAIIWVCWTASDMLDDWIRHLQRFDDVEEE